MSNPEVHTVALADEVVRSESAETPAQPSESVVNGHVAPAPEGEVTSAVVPEQTNGVADPDRHARAGRKGAHRVHQLIREGRLYEQEHGLKRGRQRLRQLIELGKLYEQEHGLRPARKRGRRLSRAGRQELVATLLECLVRIARPSFRAELTRLVEALQKDDNGHAA
jgi:hypothetical protein